MDSQNSTHAIDLTQEVELLRRENARLRARLETPSHIDEMVLRTDCSSPEGGRNVFFQEVHHRVKNNMQVICSLLKLQAESIQDAEGRRALLESRNRVFSMAALHEVLNRAGKARNVDLAAYLGDLTAHLFTALGVDRSRIRLDLDIQPVEMPLEKALPLGLIVNELLTNALLHAFPGESRGSMSVQFVKMEDGRLRLLVADDGRGIPCHLEWRTPRSLGLALVNGLAEQLGADLHLDCQSGTSFTITLPPLSRPMA